MTSITQTIPSLIGGISQQPDQLKLPGTVKDLKNLIPDITEGLIKRPSTQFVCGLSGATSNGTWFSYYRDQAEGAYIGQVQLNGDVHMWNVSDQVADDGTVTPAGTQVLENNQSDDMTASGSGYLVHSPGDLKFLTVSDTTFVTNTSKTVRVHDLEYEENNVTTIHQAYLNNDRRIASTRAGSVGIQNAHYQTYVELRQVAHGREYSFDVASPDAVEEYTSGTLTGTEGRVIRVGLGTETDSPFYQASKTGQITDSTGKVLSIDRNTSGVTYQGLDPALSFQGSEIIECTGGSGSGMIVRLTNIGQVNLSRYSGSTIKGDEYVAIYNTSVELLFGGDGYSTLDSSGNPAFVTAVMKGVTYKIFIEDVQRIKTKKDLGTFRPAPTSFDATQIISADTILDKDFANSNITPNVKKIGNGFFLSYSLPFNVTTTQPDLWRITSSTVNDVSDLPKQCKHGMIVEVINSSQSLEDNFYLEFVGENDVDGPGTWVETLAPSTPEIATTPVIPATTIHKSFDRTTVPIQITRTSGGKFKLGYTDIARRKVGDDTTNPFPTFVNKRISQTFFHRNRLGFLCEDNIILSQADEIYNFFNNSALVVSANDPIDITSSSTQPTKFIDCIETNTGLVVFGETQQFLLHTDSDSLEPNTAKLSNISTYRYSPNTVPISLGTTVGFLDAAGSYSRFFEMFDIKREGEPQLVDVTKVVSKLMPNTIDVVSISRENNTIFFSTNGTNSMYLYRYFNTGSERLQGSWFRWSFSFDVAYTFVLDDNLYLVSTDFKLVVLNLQPINNSGSTSNPGYNSDFFVNGIYDKKGFFREYEIHLDSAEFVTAGTYNSADNTTAITWTNRVGGQADPNDTTTAFVVDPSTGEVYSEKSHSGLDYIFYGNFANNNVIIGESISTFIDLPTLYVSKVSGNKVTSDVTASLTIQRLRVHFEQVSQVYIFYSSEDGIFTPGDIFDGIAAVPADRYLANKFIGDSNVTVNVPIYQRNTNFTLFLDSSHPGPFTLSSVTWEGDYTPMNHKRV